MVFLSLFILGFTSLVAQIVMTRELIVSFYGNEFFIGWILFGWLFWCGIGSIAIKFVRKALRELPLLLACHLLISALIPLSIYWTRLSKGLFISTAGQIPDLLPSLLVSLMVMAPLCLVFGAQFVAAFAYGREGFAEQGKEGGFLGRAYFYEALGFVLGGLAFSYGLIYLNEFQTSAMLITLNLMIVVIFLSIKKIESKGYFFIAAVISACLGVSCLLFSDQLNIRTAALRFPNEQLIETKNSIYGNLAVTRTVDQFNFYESGLAVGTDKDEAFNEALVHFPMLTDEHPQKVLLIGTGFSGALQEILKYKPEEIFYAELDPSIITLARTYIPAFSHLLEEEKMFIAPQDPRRSLNGLPRDMDVIIINLPNPSTALINRYYTDEFYKEVRGHLKPNGVMATHLKFAADNISSPLCDLGTSIYKTIHRHFPSVVILPEDYLFILASQSPLTQDPQELSTRMRARSIHNYFVTPQAIKYRYTTDRIAQARLAFGANSTARINADLLPRGYLYNLIYWFSIFHQDLASVIASMMRTDYLVILLLSIGSILLMPLIVRPMDRDRSLLIAAMSLGGFSLMSAELIVIYGFQVFYGNLFFKIAWIMSAFMAAMAVGTYWGNKVQRVSMINIIKLHLGIGAYFILWLLLLWDVTQLKWLPAPEIWILLGAGMGVFIGLEFSLVNILIFDRQDKHSKPLWGTVYAADLLGACLGALAVSVLMIPALGVYKTILFLALINLTQALVLFIYRR